MFEAIHGSAPRHAGQNVANPSGLLLGAVMMLVHINQPDVATLVHNAWLRTLEDGIHTYDIYTEGVSKQKVGTKEFADAIVARLGQEPQALKAVKYTTGPTHISHEHATITRKPEQKDLVGVDVFLEWHDGTPEHLGKVLQQTNGDGLELTMITNRGANVCRVVCLKPSAPITGAAVLCRPIKAILLCTHRSSRFLNTLRARL